MDCSPPGPCPWDFPGKNTEVGCHFLLQGIFPNYGSNLGLLHCRWILYQLSHQGSKAGREGSHEPFPADAEPKVPGDRQGTLTFHPQTAWTVRAQRDQGGTRWCLYMGQEERGILPTLHTYSKYTSYQTPSCDRQHFDPINFLPMLPTNMLPHMA